MRIRKLTIEHFGGIEHLEWNANARAGWHVLLGENGSGKSSALKAIALAMMGPRAASRLRVDWAQLVQVGHKAAEISVEVESDDDLARDGRRFTAGIRVDQYDCKAVGGGLPSWEDPSGWFSASYGPFRRFSGGESQRRELESYALGMARHATIFGESFALSEALDWLQELKFEDLEGSRRGASLDEVRTFINSSGLLPHETRLAEVSSRGVEFVDGNGASLPVTWLSDGYRSILSMVLDIVRHMSLAYGSGIFSGHRIVGSGVVVIDEIDAHLHPAWQHQIGPLLRRSFPKVQFIVTTHSPIVLQAASTGSVMLLPAPGSGSQPRFVTDDERSRMVYGDVSDAYSTGAFGFEVTRSDESRDRLTTLARLNRKARKVGLTKGEETERETIRRIMPADSGIVESS